jgi:hypothetical protein
MTPPFFLDLARSACILIILSQCPIEFAGLAMIKFFDPLSY